MSEVPRRLWARKPLRKLPSGRYTRSLFKWVREWAKARNAAAKSTTEATP